jgi:hypothetical protein
MGTLVENIVLLVREMRRERRRKEALRWSVADGNVVGFKTEDGLMGCSRAILAYSYKVKGEVYSGTATGVSLLNNEINQIGDALGGVSSLRVRYDPGNPRENRLLDEDNPRLPFDLDLAAK